MKKTLFFALNMLLVLSCFTMSAQAAGTGDITVFVNPGNFITGATVSFTVNGQTKTATSDYMGIARFSAIPVGTYAFKASKSGNTDGLTTAQIKEGANNVSVFMNVQKGNVSITITDKSTNQPVSEVQVTVNANGSSQYVNTGSNGVAAFTGIPAGTQTFTTLKSGYIDNSVVVSVTANTNVTSALTVTKLSTSAGGTGDITVFVNPGDAVAGAVVSFVVNGQTKQATSDAQGKVKFISIPAGTYSFKATKAAFYDGTASIAVYSGPSNTGSVVMKPQVGNINITVKDRFSNAPVSGVQVTINIPGKSQYVNTNSSGVAAFTNIQTGNYSFATLKSGYTARAESFPVNLNTTVNNTILITKPFSVTLVFKNLPTGITYNSGSVSGTTSGFSKSITSITTPQTITITEIGSFKFYAEWKYFQTFKYTKSDVISITKPGTYNFTLTAPTMTP